jgi:hypothetical protein
MNQIIEFLKINDVFLPQKLFERLKNSHQVMNRTKIVFAYPEEVKN